MEKIQKKKTAETRITLYTHTRALKDKRENNKKRIIGIKEIYFSDA